MGTHWRKNKQLCVGITCGLLLTTLHPAVARAAPTTLFLTQDPDPAPVTMITCRTHPLLKHLSRLSAEFLSQNMCTLHSTLDHLRSSCPPSDHRRTTSVSDDNEETPTAVGDTYQSDLIEIVPEDRYHAADENIPINVPEYDTSLDETGDRDDIVTSPATTEWTEKEYDDSDTKEDTTTPLTEQSLSNLNEMTFIEDTTEMSTNTENNTGEFDDTSMNLDTRIPNVESDSERRLLLTSEAVTSVTFRIIATELDAETPTEINGDPMETTVVTMTTLTEESVGYKATRDSNTFTMEHEDSKDVMDTTESLTMTTMTGEYVGNKITEDSNIITITMVTNNFHSTYNGESIDSANSDKTATETTSISSETSSAEIMTSPSTSETPGYQSSTDEIFHGNHPETMTTDFNTITFHQTKRSQNGDETVKLTTITDQQMEHQNVSDFDSNGDTFEREVVTVHADELTESSTEETSTSADDMTTSSAHTEIHTVSESPFQTITSNVVNSSPAPDLPYCDHGDGHQLHQQVNSSPYPNNPAEFINSTSTCPWKYVLRYDPDRYPAEILEAECLQSSCNQGYTQPIVRLGCEKVYLNVPVLKKINANLVEEDTEENQEYIHHEGHFYKRVFDKVAIMCTCAWKRRSGVN